LVEADVDNAAGKLLPGMFGQATIKLPSKVVANMLPARAIRFDDSDNAYVYAISSEDTISVLEVTTGIDDGHSLEVVTGLEPGQLVVDAHLKRFSNGQKVRRLQN
jgi:multidrug efflux pump subunit AcrA (membrane-fusion protein)